MSKGMIGEKRLAELLCEPHARTVAELYGPASCSSPQWLRRLQTLAKDNQMGKSILERISEFNLLDLGDGKETEDMEVELMHETEVQWFAERPPEATPAKHTKDDAIVELILKGNRPNFSPEIRRVEHALLGTSLKLPKGFLRVFENFCVTRDFCQTVELPQALEPGYMDDFIRPVEWLITPNVPNPQFIVAISPFEANEYYHLLKCSSVMRLQCFSPRYTQAMKSLEDLNTFSLPSRPTSTIPQELAHLVNLYSGSLFIRDYQTYLDLCKILRLSFEIIGVEEFGSTSGGAHIVDASFFVLDLEARSLLGMTGVARWATIDSRN
ncbi:hypothetical protein CPB86DRAFT_53370 [Serendipita vermifera]|nr:hypothetical protein CPB86DRAFT_53370 [Serendipita vermifera]